MEGMIMRESLNQANTVDGGCRFDVKKLKSYVIDSDSQELEDEDLDIKTLKSYVIDSDSQELEDEDLGVFPTSSYGSLSICGRRREMKDTMAITPRFMLSSQHSSELMVLDFFALYDGHVGVGGANFCKDKLHFLVFNEIKEFLNEGNEIDWKKVFKNSFLKMDDEAGDEGIEVMQSLGCAALVTLLSKNKIIVANCGDSKVLLCRKGQIVSLSLDQPERTDELERETVADVSITERTKNDEFMILGSDGLWNALTEEIACYVVRKCLQDRGIGASEAAALLVELAVAKESNDNISVVVIELNKA